MRTVILTIAIAALALVVQGSVLAQPLATVALPEPGGTVQLYSGCNPVALTFPDGTTSQAVVQAVSPPGVVQAIWGFNTSLRRYEGFSPAYPQASDLLTVGYLDAVWLCVAEAPLPPPAPLVTPAIPSWIEGRNVDWEYLGYGEYAVSVENTSEYWSMCELHIWIEVCYRPPGCDWYIGVPTSIPYLGPGEIAAGFVYAPWDPQFFTFTHAVNGEWTWCRPGVESTATHRADFRYVDRVR